MIDELVAALKDAVAVADGLVEQQAMRDDWYVPQLDRARAVLALHTGHSIVVPPRHDETSTPPNATRLLRGERRTCDDRRTGLDRRGMHQAIGEALDA